MKYKMIVADFDRTMYDSLVPEVTERNAKAIQDYIKAGGKFTIATGRMFKSIKPYADKLGLKGEVVCYQGACIYDIESGKELMHKPLDRNDAIELLEYLYKNDINAHMYCDDNYYAHPETPYSRKYCDFCRIDYTYTDIPLYKFLKTNDLVPTEIMIMCLAEKLQEVYPQILDKYADKFNLSLSGSYFVEISSMNANKAEGIKFIAEKNGIKQSEIIAVGDSLNDYHMIKYAGLGIAVDNAMDELKKVADMVSIQAKDDAIADIIYKVLEDKI